jgi:dCMP deaminase
MVDHRMIAWDKSFLNLCEEIAQRSKDPSTKVGACIVDQKKRIVSMGYNGFPRGCIDDPILYATRDVKLLRTIHAEVNAIITARQDLTGCTLYVSPLHPCANCAAIIVQSGIKRVVYKTTPENAEGYKRWIASFTEAASMFDEAGVTVECVE